MDSDRIRGIVTAGGKRGWLSPAELKELRGAVHKSEVPDDVAEAARAMVTNCDAGLFRAARRIPWWQRR